MSNQESWPLVDECLMSPLHDIPEVTPEDSVSRTSQVDSGRDSLIQPRPQGLLLDDFQNGGSSGEDPGKGWVTWYKISKNLGDFYHVTF